MTRPFSDGGDGGGGGSVVVVAVVMALVLHRTLFRFGLRPI